MKELVESYVKDLMNNLGYDYMEALQIAEFHLDNDYVSYDTLEDIYDV